MHKQTMKALLIVDVQNDFCKAGSLEVPDADSIIPFLNNYIALFEARRLPVFFSRDWHPETTEHFKQFGGQWPVHCVKDTFGAQFHPQLQLPKEAVIISKGTGPEEKSYSAFFAKDDQGNDFISLLKRINVEELYIGGLATDFCVKSSALDAVNSGFVTYLLIDATKAVTEKGYKEAVDEMCRHAVTLMTFEVLASHMDSHDQGRA